MERHSSADDTETELPLSQEEDADYLKTMIPNLSEHMRCIQGEVNETDGISGSYFNYESSIRVNVKSESQSPVLAPLSPPQSPEWQQQQQVYRINYRQQHYPSPQLWPPLTNGKLDAGGKMMTSYEIIPHDLSSMRRKGRYEFQMEFDTEKKPPSKSCAYTYSKQLHRLFIQRNSEVPLVFQTKFSIPKQHAQLRCFLRYKDNRFKGDVVERCPLHLRQDKDEPEREHILRSIKKDTVYTKSQSGHSVAIVQPNQQQGTSFVETFVFTCSSTCKGGINRRPIVAYFLLYIGDQLEGHASIDVCVCACPGRDRTNAEKKDTATKNLSTEESPAISNLPGHSSTTAEPATEGASKRSLSSSSDDEMLSTTGKPPKLLKFTDSSGEDDQRLYQVTLPPVTGKQNAKTLVHICTLMVNKSSKKEVLMKVVDNTDDLPKSSKPAAVATTCTTKDLVSPKKSLNLQRSASDNRDYKRDYRQVNITIVSDLPDTRK